MDKTIYLDMAATTPIDSRVLDKMMPWLTSEYGNPSTQYGLGERAAGAIYKAREEIALLINADPDEIYFTSGGTESDNWAIASSMEYSKANGRNSILVSSIEHHAVSKFCEEKKYDVVEQEVDWCGLIDLYTFQEWLRSRRDIGVASIMLANNEIGTVEPIETLSLIAKSNNVIFHTDAVQAFGHIPIDVKKLGVHMLSASGHKINAPKGIGCLYIRKDIMPKISPYIIGGYQERGMRASTENVAGIVGFGEAARLCREEMNIRNEEIHLLKLYLLSKLEEISGIHANGIDLTENNNYRLKNNLNFRIDGVSGTRLQQLLAEKNICISVGSACNSGNPEPSHVLKAIGLSDKQAHESIRITLGHENTFEDIDIFSKWFKTYVNLLRNIE